MPKAGGKPVDKRGKIIAQTLELITPSTIGLLEISHALAVVRFFNPALPQAEVVSTQAKAWGFSLLDELFYPLSPTPTTTTKLNKGFVV